MQFIADLDKILAYQVTGRRSTGDANSDNGGSNGAGGNEEGHGNYNNGSSYDDVTGADDVTDDVTETLFAPLLLLITPPSVEYRLGDEIQTGDRCDRRNELVAPPVVRERLFTSGEYINKNSDDTCLVRGQNEVMETVGSKGNDESQEGNDNDKMVVEEGKKKGGKKKKKNSVVAPVTSADSLLKGALAQAKQSRAQSKKVTARFLLRAALILSQLHAPSLLPHTVHLRAHCRAC